MEFKWSNAGQTVHTAHRPGSQEELAKAIAGHQCAGCGTPLPPIRSSLRRERVGALCFLRGNAQCACGYAGEFFALLNGMGVRGLPDCEEAMVQAHALLPPKLLVQSILHARYLVHNRAWTEADTLLDCVAQVYPDCSSAAALRADVAFSTGSDARQVLERARTALALAPGNGRLFARLSSWFSSQGQREKSEYCAVKAKALSATPPGRPTPEKLPTLACGVPLRPADNGWAVALTATQSSARVLVLGGDNLLAAGALLAASKDVHVTVVESQRQVFEDSRTVFRHAYCTRREEPITWLWTSPEELFRAHQVGSRPSFSRVRGWRDRYDVALIALSATNETSRRHDASLRSLKRCADHLLVRAHFARGDAEHRRIAGLAEESGWSIQGAYAACDAALASSPCDWYLATWRVASPKEKGTLPASWEGPHASAAVERQWLAGRRLSGNGLV